MKSLEDAFYRRVCGARLASGLDNLRRVRKSGIHLEIFTLVISRHSSDPAMLERLAGFIASTLGLGVPWHLLPFYPGISWNIHETPATDSETLEAAWQIGKKDGLKHVYSAFHNNTQCHALQRNARCARTAVHRSEHRTV